MKFFAVLSLCLILGLAYCDPKVTPDLGVRTKQAVGAKGRLTCDGKPAAKVLVKIYDKDRFVSMDDKIASTRTDAQGNFQLQGTAREMSKIDPKLYIFHDCNDGIMPCQRRVSIIIPDRYVNDGETARQLYDAGSIELAGKFSGETRDCIH
ncbi:transthyretin-like family domain-containing protein [Ditylenchus destructor]|nr:transthyretin-like family domain-containing protein [Ditylenchus destructor]